MHSAQILLEEWQFEALKAASEQKGRSVSHLVREILTKHFSDQGDSSRDPLSSIEGVADEPGSYGRNHDEVLYSRR